MHNTVISDSTDNTLPIDSGGSMTPLDLTNNVTPVDSVNNDSVAPQPTEAPSFLGKNSFFLKFLSPKYYGNNRSRMYIRSLLLFLFL